MDYILDYDDFYEENSSLSLLYYLRSHIEGFKVNLFTIVGRCSTSFIEEVQKIEWIDLIPHGLKHETNYECKDWGLQASLGYLGILKDMQLTKGFKAPGWQISDGMYQALLQEGYWVADQIYNNERRPAALKAYLLDRPWKIHGHIGHLGGENANELSRMRMDLLTLKGNFHFIKDVL